MPARMAQQPASVFALAMPDQSDPPRLQYLARAATVGNLMRTLSPASAWTWANEAEVVAWLDRLPEAARNQIADRELLVVPVEVSVGAPTKTFRLETVELGDKASGEKPKRQPLFS